MQTREVVTQEQLETHGFEIQGVSMMRSRDAELLRIGSIYYQGAYVGNIEKGDDGKAIKYTIVNANAIKVLTKVTETECLTREIFLERLLTNALAKERIVVYKMEHPDFTGEIFHVQYSSSYIEYTTEKIAGHDSLTFDNIQKVLQLVNSEAYEHANSITLTELDEEGYTHVTVFNY